MSFGMPEKSDRSNGTLIVPMMVDICRSGLTVFLLYCAFDHYYTSTIVNVY